MNSRLIPIYKGSWFGILRICVWSLFFLYAFGKLIPELPEQVPLEEVTRNTQVIPLLTNANDHRTVREDVAPNPEKININWISDSSGVMIDPGESLHTFPQDKFRLLPLRVAEKLTHVHGIKDFQIPLYLRLSMLPVDTLVFALRALRDKPDMIVLPINTVWAFSHYQVASRDRSMHLAPSVFAGYLRLWPMMLAFCTPMQQFYSVAGGYFDVLHNAVPVKAHFQTKFQDWLSAAGMVPEPVKIGLNVPITNVPYWLYVNMLIRDAAPLLDPNGSIDTSRIYNQVIQHATPAARGSWATDSFQDLIAILKESGVPVIIYSWPVSDRFLNDPATKQKILEIQAFLAKERDALADSNIRILTPVPEKVRKSVSYLAKDDYHATNEGLLDDYLASNINDMLKHKSAAKEKKGD